MQPTLACAHNAPRHPWETKGPTSLERSSLDLSDAIGLRPIGHIRSPFTQAAGTPIQSVYAHNIEGQVIVDAPFEAALDDIEGFERIWLVYWMDRMTTVSLRVVPYRDTREHGVFATRAPCRPNPIGLSVVRLLRREHLVLHVADIDVLDATPLLDIKPYVPEFDAHPGAKAGWFDACGEDRRTADVRFHEPGTASPRGRLP
jgi:tRNA (adenine37-N6)-methyltransferase